MFTTESLDNDIAQITESVFSTMLGIEIARAAAPPAPQTGLMMTGVVCVAGSWNGAITIACGMDCARRIASTMFGSELSATTESELNDAIGEMANMIGGNFKSMLEPPTQLSLPSVTQGAGYRVNLPGCRELGRYDFLAQEDVITVTVLERA